MVLKMTKFQHITAAIRDQLHWLPVKQRVEFKQALFVYKVLRQTAPLYLADMCQPDGKRVPRDAIFARPLTGSCGAAMQNIRKDTESEVFLRLLH